MASVVRLLLLALIIATVGGCDFFSEDEAGYRLAFSNLDENAAHYAPRLSILDVGTDEVRPLSTGAGASLHVSSDRSTLLWREVDVTDWHTRLFVADADGGNQVRLLAGVEEEIGWARIGPDGSLVAVSRWHDGALEIFVVQRDGSGLRQLTDAGRDAQPLAISPDGRKLLFQRIQSDTANEEQPAIIGLFVIDIDGTDLTHLTDAEDPMWKRNVSFSPDGEKILFTRPHAEGTTWRENDLFIINVDGTGLTRLTDDPQRENWMGAFHIG